MIEGLLLLDKPRGPTSHDVVAAARRILGRPRVGHAGTLDPMASGLLPLVIGRATRLVRFLPSSPKTYEGTIELGWSSATDDAMGEVVTRHGGPLPGRADVLSAASRLTGPLLQSPPAFSARKVDGTRLYRLARRGTVVEAPRKEVTVWRFDLTAAGAEGAWNFVAEVSGGTYIRSLARDLGEALGCGGVLTRLVRRAIGPMRLEAAVPFPADAPVEAETLVRAIVPLEKMPLAPLPVALPDEEACRRFRAGARVPAPAAAPENGPYRVLGSDGSLLGIGEVRSGELRPMVVLPPPA